MCSYTLFCIQHIIFKLLGGIMKESKKDTKKLLLNAAVAGIFAAGMTTAKLAPAFAQEGDAEKPAAEKASCKGKEGCGGKADEAKEKGSCHGKCKSGHGCSGPEHKGKAAAKAHGAKKKKAKPEHDGE